jgi:hypothetical protein
MEIACIIFNVLCVFWKKVTTMSDLLSSVRAVLTATPLRWLRIAESTPAALLQRPAASGEWSAIECLYHLIDTEQNVFPVRIQAFMQGQDFPGFNPHTQGSTVDSNTAPLEVATLFAQLRTANLATLAEVGTADLDRRAIHAELGQVTLREMLNQWAAHDLSHTVQAEEAMMQFFMDGCGPWRKYFAAHEK